MFWICIHYSTGCSFDLDLTINLLVRSQPSMAGHFFGEVLGELVRHGYLRLPAACGCLRAALMWHAVYAWTI